MRRENERGIQKTFKKGFVHSANLNTVRMTGTGPAHRMGLIMSKLWDRERSEGFMKTCRRQSID